MPVLRDGGPFLAVERAETGCARSEGGGAPMLKPGDAAPDFKVKDHLGEEWTLAKLKGKSAVIWFYPKADTPG